MSYHPWILLNRKRTKLHLWKLSSIFTISFQARKQYWLLWNGKQELCIFYVIWNRSKKINMNSSKSDEFLLDSSWLTHTKGWKHNSRNCSQWKSNLGKDGNFDIRSANRRTRAVNTRNMRCTISAIGVSLNLMVPPPRRITDTTTIACPRDASRQSTSYRVLLPPPPSQPHQ